MSDILKDFKKFEVVMYDLRRDKLDERRLL